MYGCGEQEVGVASDLWVWLLGVVVRRYIDFLVLLIPTPLVSVLFCSSPTFCSLKKKFFYIYKATNNYNTMNANHITDTEHTMISSVQVL